MSLPQLRDSFSKTRRQPSEEEFPELEYCSDDVLRFLEDKAEHDHYDIQDLAQRFSREAPTIVRTLGEEGRIPAELANRVSLLMKQRARDQGALDFAWLFYWEERREGRASLLHQLEFYGSKEEEFRRHAGLIMDACLGVYMTGLPDLLDSAPVYPKEHEAAISSFRHYLAKRVVGRGNADRQVQRREFDPVVVHSVLGPATYASYLRALTFEIFVQLRESDEWKRYQAVLSRVQWRFDDETIQEFRAAIGNYRARIDFVLGRRSGLWHRDEQQDYWIRPWSEWFEDSLVSVGISFVASQPVATLVPVGFTVIKNSRRLNTGRIRHGELDEIRARAAVEARKRGEEPILSIGKVMPKLGRETELL